MKEIFIFPDVLQPIKIHVFVLKHKNILVKENNYLPDDRKSVKLEVVNAKCIYVYIYIYTKIYQEMSYAIVRLPHPRSGDSQGEETFFAHPLLTIKPATRNYDTHSAQTTIPPNHHKALRLSRGKKK